MLPTAEFQLNFTPNILVVSITKSCNFLLKLYYQAVGSPLFSQLQNVTKSYDLFIMTASVCYIPAGSDAVYSL